MTKSELKNVMVQKGAPRERQLTEWNDAFNLYNAANPSKALRRGPCSSCYNKVWEFIITP